MARCEIHVPIRSIVLFLVLAAGGLLSAPLPATAAAEGEPQAAPKDVAELKALEARIKSAVARITACTVGVRKGASSGSGVIVSEDGLVMTAGHVVDKPGQDVTILLPDGKSVKGKTLGVYKTADAGLMKITDAGKWSFAAKGKSADVRAGQWCLAVGHPLGYQEKRPPVVRVGRILRVSETVIQSDCPLVGGDSGGPLFDLDGNVIGINSRIGGSMLQNFHVPVDVFRTHWDRLAKGEAWADQMPARNDDQVKSVLRGLLAAAGRCAARIVCDGKEVALGTVVGPDGWILTKASELKGDIVCRLTDGRELETRIVGIDPRFDLAMLKADAVDLPRIEWNLARQAVGQWVAAPGADGQPLAIGVVSVPRRPIPLRPGMLGVVFADAKGGARIARVLAKSPAEKAGLKVKDLVTAVNGEPTPNRSAVIKIVKKFPPGTAVKMKVRRGDQQLELKATLGKLNTPATRKRELQNALGVGVSKRRDAFPMVLQHDMALRPADCGGPLVDLSGKVVGVNIARGGRTETYCVPSDVLITLMYDLMSGRLTPAQVTKARAEAARQAAAASRQAEKEKAAREKAAEEKAAREKADKAAAEKGSKAKAEKEAVPGPPASPPQKQAGEKQAAGRAAEPKPKPASGAGKPRTEPGDAPQPKADKAAAGADKAAAGK